MSNLKYFPVGSMIMYHETILKVVAQEENEALCDGCYILRAFQRRHREYISCYVHGISCTASRRKNRKHIILVEES